MAISCEPDNLAEAAKCYGCIPNHEQVVVYLLCQLASQGSSPPPLQLVNTDLGSNPSTTAITLSGSQNAVRVFTGGTPISEVGFTLYVKVNGAGVTTRYLLYAYQGRILTFSPGDSLAFATVDGRQLQMAPMTVPAALPTATGITGTANADKSGPPVWTPTAAHITLPANVSAFQLAQTGGDEKYVFISEYDGTQWSRQRFVMAQSNYDVTVQCNYKQIALATWDGSTVSVKAPVGSTIGGTSTVHTLVPAMTGTQRNCASTADFLSAVAVAVSGDRIVLSAGTYAAVGDITAASFVANQAAGKVGPEGITIMGATGTASDVILQGRFVITSNSTAGAAYFKDLSVDANSVAAKQAFALTDGNWVLENVTAYGTAATVNLIEIIDATKITFRALFCTFRNSGGDVVNGDSVHAGSSVWLMGCTAHTSGAAVNDQVVTPHNGAIIYLYGGRYYNANANVIAGAAITDLTLMAFLQVDEGGLRECGAPWAFGVYAYACRIAVKAQQGPYCTLCKLYSPSGTWSAAYRNYTSILQSNWLVGSAIGRGIFNSVGGGTFRNNLIQNLAEKVRLANSSSAQTKNTFHFNTIVGTGTIIGAGDDNLPVALYNNVIFCTNHASNSFTVTPVQMAGSSVDYNVLSLAMDADYSAGANDLTSTDASLDANYFPVAAGNCDKSGGSIPLVSTAYGDTDPFGFVHKYAANALPRGCRARAVIYTGALLYPDLW